MQGERANNFEENPEEFFQNYYPEVLSNSHNNQQDTKSKIEEVSLFGGGLDEIDVWLKHEEFRLKKINSDSERKLREAHATKAFWFSIIWVFFILVFIFLHGFKLYSCFNLTETEFLFLCGTFTTSVFAFYLIVIKNLFPNKT